VTPHDAIETLDGLYGGFLEAIDRGIRNDVIGIWEQHLEKTKESSHE
jgi:hypothetical protein